MRHFVRCVIAAWVVASVAHAAPVGAVAELDRSIARVGDVVIWDSEVTARAKPIDNDRVAALESLIDDELIAAAARKEGISTDRAELMLALEEIKTQNKLDDAGLDAALKEYGYTRARYMADLERQIIVLRAKNQLVGPKVSIEDSVVEAEVKRRKLPLTVANKDEVRTALRRRELAEEEARWVKELRRHAFITRRP